VVPSLVLKTVGVMCRVRRVFEAFDNLLILKTVGIMRRVRRVFGAFDDLDRDLAQFVVCMVFPRCDQFLVSWSRRIESGLT
jgi:hypothetical protein